MVKYFTIIVLGGLFFASSCKQAETAKQGTSKDENSVKVTYPQLFQDVLDAHGGIDAWNGMGTLQYDMVKEEGNETQLIDLRNRKVNLHTDKWELGFDGKEVWVKPDMETFGRNSARFYHNLMFYFYAMPYVLADPGVNYEVLEEMEIGGEKLLPISTSFNSGVGDAPEDEYILLVDPETKRLEILLYTVTYFSKAKGKKYNALVYDEYTTVDGLLFPTVLKGYKYEDGVLGDERYTRNFENISVSKDQPDQSLFEMPEGAVIDSLK